MSEYREITLEEIKAFSAKIAYVDQLDINDICENLTKFFGPEAAFATLDLGDEYNDESYNLRVTGINVKNENGANLVISTDLLDNYYDWIYPNLRLLGESYDGGRKAGPYLIDIKNKNLIIEEMPKLYIKI